MIDIRAATPEQIRRLGIDALTRELGVAGMLRFLQQFDPKIDAFNLERARASLSADALTPDAALALADEAKHTTRPVQKPTRSTK